MAQQTVTDIANGEQSIELTFEQFYTDDACCLKANPSRIGLVDVGSPETVFEAEL